MKYLRQYEYFDWNGFAKQKKFMTVGISPLTDYETKELIGTKVEVVITSDSTPYERKENEQGSNLFEKLIVKVPKQIDVPMQVEVQLKKCSSNNLWRLSKSTFCLCRRYCCCREIIAFSVVV